MFYKDLIRRTEYPKKASGDNYGYSWYETHIMEDCQDCCVYCDIHLLEMGGEGLQLDHFKPRKHFPDLKNEPTNLVSSCPKCNRLKWHHWPEPPFNFVDPFQAGRAKNFQINGDGRILGVSESGRYQVKLMALNRPARRQTRSRRLLLSKLDKIEESLLGIDEQLLEGLDEGLAQNELTLRVSKLKEFRDIRAMALEIRRLLSVNDS